MHTQPVVEPDFAGLGERIKARRRKVGLSSKRLGQLGGPSEVTLRNMERGEPVWRRIDTTHPLESILGWAPDSIEGFLRYGTEPIVVREPDYSETKIGTADLTDVPTEVLEQALRERNASK